MAAIEYEEPTFQNAAQAERAANLAYSSFTEDDMQDAKDQAEEDATKQIDGLAKDHADSVVDQISSDHVCDLTCQRTFWCPTGHIYSSCLRVVKSRYLHQY